MNKAKEFLENHINIKEPVKVFDLVTNKVVRIKGNWIPIQNGKEAVRIAREEEQKIFIKEIMAIDEKATKKAQDECKRYWEKRIKDFEVTKEQVEVRVCEETARKIKNIINSEPIGNSKFVYIGNIINKINKSFLVKSEVQKK